MNNDIETDDSSYQAFVEDAWIRSFECRDWVWRFEPHRLSHGWNGTQLAELRNLYKQITQYLKSQVKVGNQATEIVSFHKKFGWIVCAGGSKAFLGKSIIPENLPIEIGKQSYISGSAKLHGRAPLKIGSFSTIADGLYINTSVDMHPTEYASMMNFDYEERCRENGLGMDIHYEQFDRQNTGIEIGSDVWLGRDVRIYHGTKISHGCVVGERSLIKGLTEPFGIYVGVPAKLKKFRFSDKVISDLLDIAWWTWEDARLLRNKLFFETNLNEFSGDVKSLIKE